MSATLSHVHFESLVRYVHWPGRGILSKLATPARSFHSGGLRRNADRKCLAGIGFTNRKLSAAALPLSSLGVNRKLHTKSLETMKSLVYKSTGTVALEERPKPSVAAPTDAIVKISRTTIAAPTCTSCVAMCRHALLVVSSATRVLVSSTQSVPASKASKSETQSSSPASLPAPPAALAAAA